MGIKSCVKRVLMPSKKVYCNLYGINESEKLKGKNIVVTGGSSGIGKAIAFCACKAGANVLVVGRNEERLKLVANDFSNNCFYYVCDIANEIEQDIFFDFENKLQGHIDVLVNNAGIYVDNKYLNYSSSEFDEIMNTNTKSPFILSQLYIRYCLLHKKQGNIIFTTSNRSLMGDFGPYGMSKAAINNLIEGLARENIATGIRVNGVAPGMTASGINGLTSSDNLYTSSARGERVLLPEEIAEVVCFLASDISKCITGAIIPCDDGDRLR